MYVHVATCTRNFDLLESTGILLLIVQLYISQVLESTAVQVVRVPSGTCMRSTLLYLNAFV